MNVPTRSASADCGDVTLVVPVFKALDDTVACIESLLRSDARDCTILVNDDGSPSDVGEALNARFASVRNVILRTNFRNRGYTANVGYGVSAARTPYVGIVNSDTLFPRRWLWPMLDSLERHPFLAAVGPLSNAATYQSIPELFSDSGASFSVNSGLGRSDTDRERLSRLLSGMFGGLEADVPILNGFCTIFRTAAVRAIGGFDAVNFRKGYGEENDLCLRLLGGGWRLAVRLDTFVHHAKSRSFGADLKAELSKRGRETLARLYGENFVSDFATLLERHPVLASVRYAIKAVLDAPPARASAAEGFDHVAASLDEELVALSGPCVATIWEDFHQVAPVDLSLRPNPSKVTSVLLGRNMLRVELPEGRNLHFCRSAALETVLAVLAAWSQVSPVVISRLPGSPDKGRLAKSLEHLNFSLLYHEPDFDCVPEKTGGRMVLQSVRR